MSTTRGARAWPNVAGHGQGWRPIALWLAWLVDAALLALAVLALR